MASIWDERFETATSVGTISGTYYEEIWDYASTPNSFEAISSGCSQNADYATTNISSPTNWDTYCLRSYVDANGKWARVRKEWATAPAVTYTHVEVYITDWSLITSSSSSGFLVALDNSWNNSWSLCVTDDGSGNKDFRYQTEGGTYYSDDYNGGAHLSLNAKYQLEVYHNVTTGAWAWRGSAGDNTPSSWVSGGSGMTRAVKRLEAGISDSWQGMTICIDNILIDDSTWPTIGGVTIEQEGFRWRNDDGNETTATWNGSQDANLTAPAGNTQRLRFVLNTTGDANAMQIQIEGKKSTDSVWSKIT